ncbi:MAG: hypothetical protein MMC33_007552 [Icmadophila ericetorum]|nr:hypothetical protein [Icmadophila ericetorum]
MVTGDIFTDDVGIGDSPVIIQALQMAVATEATNEPLGIMGIGFDTFESAAVQGGQPYPNVPDALVKQGLINTRAYSLYLDDQEAATGSIIFGGFDAAKFSGELSAVPMIPDANGVVDQMLVALTDVQINDPQDGPASIFSTAVPALLDSGTTISFLPTDTFAYLVSFTGAVNDQTYGWILLCSVSTYTGTLDYSFGDQGGPTISVPFSEVIRPLTDPDGNPITDSSGNEYCSFGIGPQPDGEPVVLGDTFLRSAYVLYDLDSQLIALGQTLFNSAQSEIVELGASQDGIVVASGSPDGGSAPTVTVSALSVGASGPALTETATQRVGPQTENTDGGSAITVTPTVGAVQTGGLASLRATKTKGVGVTGGSGAGGTTTASALATVTGKGAASPMLSPSGAVWVLLAMGAVFSMVLSFQV